MDRADDDNPNMRKLMLTVVCLVVAGCVPPGPTAPQPTTPATTTPPTSPPPTAPPTAPPTTAAAHAPVISSFTAATTSAPSPLTTALRWTVSDPDGDTLTCRLDLDNNGSTDVTVAPCTSASSRTRTFTVPGTRTVGLTVTDGANSSSAALNLSVGAASVDDYQVTLRFSGTPTVGQMNAFTAAAAKWASIVKTGQPDRAVNLVADACMGGTAPFSGTVDDLMIDAQIVAIDGPGGILGQAGPCLLRQSNGMPVYGIMQFDSADVASLESSGQLANTIIHEMGHILGVGTIWSNKGVLSGAATSDPTFTGTAANGIWSEFGGTGSVPVENSGGAGTRDSHWREAIFGTELMTGYLNVTNKLSMLSSASLADLGYGVDLSGSDTYTLPAVHAASVADDHGDEDGHGDHDHGGVRIVMPYFSV